MCWFETSMHASPPLLLPFSLCIPILPSTIHRMKFTTLRNLRDLSSYVSCLLLQCLTFGLTQPALLPLRPLTYVPVLHYRNIGSFLTTKIASIETHTPTLIPLWTEMNWEMKNVI
jgi:hypothetical protein